MRAVVRSGQTNALYSVAAFFFVVAVGEFAALRALFSTRALVMAGVASYSIYLVHGPFIALAAEHGASVILALGAALAAGFAFWALVEHPFVDGRLRAPAISAVEARLGHYARRLGLDTCAVSLARRRASAAHHKAIA